MPKTRSRRPAAKAAVTSPAEQLIRVRLRALEIPPIKDGLVIGREAAIGGEAMSRTLRLMTTEKFHRIPVKDDLIEDVIIRESIMKKLGQEQLLRFVLERVKPLMTATELLMLDIGIELVIEDSL